VGGEFLLAYPLLIELCVEWTIYVPSIVLSNSWQKELFASSFFLIGLLHKNTPILLFWIKNHYLIIQSREKLFMIGPDSSAASY